MPWLEDVRDKLVRFVQKISPPRPVFDPATLGDPLATRTSWSPCVTWGTNVHTHRLRSFDAGRMEFKITWGAICFCLFFVGLGTAVASSSIGSFLKNLPPSKIWIPILIGASVAGIGGFLFYFVSRPIVFDKLRNQFINRKGTTALSEVHALQVLAKTQSSSRGGSYVCYELNLVQKNTQRKNVVVLANYKLLMEDAKKLSRFLGVPLWTAQEQQ